MRLGSPHQRRFLRHYLGNTRERRRERIRNHARVEWLRRFIGPLGVGAELGVHKGYFSSFLLTHLQPQKLYLIDPWYRQGKYWNWGDGNRNIVDALCTVLHETEDDLVSGRAVLVVEDDLTALAKMPDGHLDWAYLDTNHKYEQSTKELQLLNVKVKAGGIIAGDDWQPDPSHKHHMVCRAVKEFVEREGYRHLDVDVESTQWAIRRE